MWNLWESFGLHEEKYKCIKDLTLLLKGWYRHLFNVTDEKPYSFWNS